MFLEERKNEMEQYILEQGTVSVGELSRKFGVSEVTVRKDLDELQKGNLIMRTHGGAMIKCHSSAEHRFGELAVKCKEEKQIIAAKALEFIENGDSIILDGSTTVSELAVLINQSSLKDLTIITNSISVAQILMENVYEIILIGGHLNRKMQSSDGMIAEKQIAAMNVDKSFIGINGIDRQFGLSACSFQEAGLKEHFLKASKQSFVLADHTKFAKRYMVQVTGAEQEIDYIITSRRYEHIEYEEIDRKVGLIFAQE